VSYQFKTRKVKKMSEPRISRKDEDGVIAASDEEFNGILEEDSEIPEEEDSDILEEDVLDPSLEDTEEETRSAVDGPDVEVMAIGADKAIAWYRQRAGSRELEHKCERAARMSWGCPAKYGSANAHWAHGGPRHTSGRPPKGAFVFWNIGKPYGHVGIADGKGGFWATSVNHKIGHAKSVRFYRNYRGWIPGGCR
jgi:hypothetical protein